MDRMDLLKKNPWFVGRRALFGMGLLVCSLIPACSGDQESEEPVQGEGDSSNAATDELGSGVEDANLDSGGPTPSPTTLDAAANNLQAALPEPTPPVAPAPVAPPPPPSAPPPTPVVPVSLSSGLQK